MRSFPCRSWSTIVAAAVLVILLAVSLLPLARLASVPSWLAGVDLGIVHDAAAATTAAGRGDAQAPLQVAADTSAQTQDEDAAGEDKKENAKVVLPPGPATPLPEGDAQLSQLLRLWGVFGAKIKASCATLHVGDLHCLSEQGTMATLERFNRPAILVLKYGGREQRVLLSELGKDTASLTGAEGTRRIARDRLARLWSGQFFMIWRADAKATSIDSRMSGPAVIWLRRRLARASDKSPDTQVGPPSPIFDAQLERRVRHFQLMHGLKPDGIVGARTQIMLNGIAPEPGTPTLAPKPEKKD